MSYGKWAIGAVVLIVIIIGTVLRKRMHSSVTSVSKEVRGTFTFIDVEKRTAAIEIINPSSNAAMEVSGQVPPECRITLDDKPATLADLKAGDKALIKARMIRQDRRSARHVIADEIHVTRS